MGNFISFRQEKRDSLIYKTVGRWNSQVAVKPFYRRPTVWEISSLAGLKRVYVREINEALTKLKEEVN